MQRTPRRAGRTKLAVAAFVASALSASVAGAAPPPRAERGSPEPHGFVEPCTVGNVQEMHTECEVCTIEGQSKTCHERFGERGYVKTCSTRGGHSAPAEVWCLDKRAAKSPAKNPGLLLALGLSIALGVFVVLKRTRANRRPSK